MLHQLVLNALLILHLQFGFDYPKHTPQILMVDRAALPCRCLAGYREGAIYLVLGERLDTVAMQGKVLHEVVHHLQYEAKGSATDCQDWSDREDRAIEIQRIWVGQREGLTSQVIWKATCQ